MPRWTLPATALAITAAAAALLTGCGKGGHADPLPSVHPSPTPTPTATPSFQVATSLTGSQPNAVRVGPSNTIWFTDRSTNAIGKMAAQPGSLVTMIKTPQSGTPPQYSTPTQMSPYDSTSGKFWFSEFNSSSGVNDIVSLASSNNKMTPVGLNLTSDQIPQAIVVSPDSTAVWVYVSSATAGNNAIYRYVPTTGKYSQFSLNTTEKTRRFAFDKSGNLWMTERLNSDLMEFAYDQTTDKIVKKQTVNLQASGSPTQPTDIALGPDGNLWVADFVNAIYKVDPVALSFTPFAISQIPGCTSGSTSIVPAPTGNNFLWFSDWRCNAIGQITTSGQVTEYSASSAVANGHPNLIAVTPDGSVWYGDQGSSTNQQLVRFKP